MPAAAAPITGPEPPFWKPQYVSNHLTTDSRFTVARHPRDDTRGCQLISTFRRVPWNCCLVAIRNEARIIVESPPHAFRQPGLKVYPFPSEPLVGASMHLRR